MAAVEAEGPAGKEGKSSWWTRSNREPGRQSVPLIVSASSSSFREGAFLNRDWVSPDHQTREHVDREIVGNHVHAPLLPRKVSQIRLIHLAAAAQPPPPVVVEQENSSASALTESITTRTGRFECLPSSAASSASCCVCGGSELPPPPPGRRALLSISAIESRMALRSSVVGSCTALSPDKSTWRVVDDAVVALVQQ